MVYITLCPNCRTLQKAGTQCSLCGCPVVPPNAKHDDDAVRIKNVKSTLPSDDERGLQP